MSFTMAMSTSPRATYRLQFNEDFRFDDARRIVSYLAELGVSHVYASPLLMSRPGSRHGYDIVDHSRLNPEIGTQAEFDAFIEELRCYGLGLILDFVPNHMGVGPDNPWWVDVLEWGRASPFAAFFDIDWDPLEPTLAGKVLLPVLGDHYGAVLERGELTLQLDAENGSFAVAYFDTPFPIAPRDYASLLQAASRRSPGAARLLGPIADELRACFRSRGGRRALMARREQTTALKRELASGLAEDPESKQAVMDELDELNGRSGQGETFESLHRLLDRQAYRLAFWRVAAYEINYRRFFDINDLAGLRMDRAELFEASHGLVRRLIAEGKIQGLRLDHVDGLRDPKDYFERLQRLATAKPLAHAVRDRKRLGPKGRTFYVLVEKILAPHEGLRNDWAVSGTTGYEFTASVNGLFVDPAGERPLTRAYERLIERSLDFEEMVVDAKRQIMHEALASELSVLANLFNRLAKRHKSTRDFSQTGIREALASVIAHFPVYRTYVTEKGASGEDRRDIDWAVGKARRSTRSPGTSIYDFIHDVLTLDLPSVGRGYRRRDVMDAMLKFQQLTGPVMAKAMEDTTFYRYVRLVSLNEVGGEPSRFGVRPTAFHDANQARRRLHPYSMVTTATHDHKRGEDVRARLNVLSEAPREWVRRVRRWLQLNTRKRTAADGRPAPSRNDEYLFYQTIVGAWPYDLRSPGFEGMEEFRGRIDAYMRKAIREAKLRTSWAAPNDAYEKAVSDFVTRTLDPGLSRPFLEDVYGLVEHIAVAGAVNGLAQVLLKLVSPGVPDIYQGTELWDLSLVDPDNRRPVDYSLRRVHLQASGRTSCGELLATWRDGRVKQHVIHRALDIRRLCPALFNEGEYLPLTADGPHAARVLAFTYRRGEQALMVIVPRLVWPLVRGEPQPLPRNWGATRISVPQGRPGDECWYDTLSGVEQNVSADGTMALAQVLETFPVALLVNRLEMAPVGPDVSMPDQPALSGAHG